MKLPRKKDYPKEVVVNEEHYKIKFVNKVDGDSLTYGDCNPHDKVIRLKRGSSAAETFATYIHELIHAMEFEYEIKISHDTVYKLDKAISDFFLQNF